MTDRPSPSRSPASLAIAVAVAAASAAACGDKKPPPLPSQTEQIDAAVKQGAQFLVTRQDADGAVRSPTYAAFRDGYALTGLAAMALGMAGERAAFAKASDFLATLVDEAGALREVGYPTYAAALAVLVFNHPGNARHQRVRDLLVAELRKRQLGPENGWSETDASYGGWGYYARIPTRPPGPIHDDMLSSNLSATLLVVGALALAGVPPDDPALVRATGFVERCQNFDGGFFFSPAVPDANKAGPGPEGFRSYGSMTADGVRALRQLRGFHERIRIADAWLAKHFDPERNPGVFAQEVRRASAYYYWAWTAAHAMRAAGGPTSWATALASHVMAKQRPDGSWKNQATEMREDDPVVATSLAMAALLVCRIAISGEYDTHTVWKGAAPTAGDGGALVP